MSGAHAGKNSWTALESSGIISGVRQAKERSWGQQKTQSPKAKAESAPVRAHSSWNKPSAKAEQGKASLPEGCLAHTDEPQQALADWCHWAEALLPPASACLDPTCTELIYCKWGCSSVALSVITVKCHWPSPDFHTFLRYNSLLTSKREGATSFNKTPHPSFSIIELPGFCHVEGGHMAHTWESRGLSFFQSEGNQTSSNCFFSTENIYLQEMKSITYFTTYIFRLQKQVVCSLTESSRWFKKEKEQFLSTQWTCLQCEQSGGTISRWQHLYKNRKVTEHRHRVK